MALDLIGPLMSSMLTCATSALDPPVARAALYPGAAVAWDDCCDGQAWVRLVRLVPSGTGSQPSSQALPCGVLMWQATFGLGVLRCAATLDDQGNAPTPAELTADTLLMTADEVALSEAIQCCITALPSVEKLTMVGWNPLGPDGGCVGGEWTFTLLVANCPCGAGVAHVYGVSGSVDAGSGV